VEEEQAEVEEVEERDESDDFLLCEEWWVLLDCWTMAAKALLSADIWKLGRGDEKVVKGEKGTQGWKGRTDDGNDAQKGVKQGGDTSVLLFAANCDLLLWGTTEDGWFTKDERGEERRGDWKKERTESTRCCRAKRKERKG
jgi:hypothetical protein